MKGDLPSSPAARAANIQLAVALQKRWAPEIDSGQVYAVGTREREVQSKNRRAARDYAKEFGSISAACLAVGISKSSFYYRSKDSIEAAESEANIRDRIEQAQAEFPFYGYRRLYEHFKQKMGTPTNRKTILRIMRKYGLKALIWRTGQCHRRKAPCGWFEDYKQNITREFR